jgi:L-asparaginase
VTVQRPCPPTGALLPTEGLAATADVAVVHSGLGVGADTLERALAAGVDGVVVEGTGLGNVTGALGDAIGEAVASVPVVVASRCHAGPTEAVYGTPGGAVTLRRHGVTFAGDLPASKARVALVVALTAEVSTERRRSAFG